MTSPTGSPTFVAGDAYADVCVVIVTYNSARDIDRAIASLRTEAAAQRIRVIVVDNASSDGTVAAVREHADVILLDGGGNRGFAAGINVATTRFGECSTILILNPDAEVAAGSIAVLRRRLRTTGAGAVAPLIQDAAGERYASLRREASTRRALGDAVMGRFFRGRPAGLSEIVHDDTNYATAHPIDWASGAALLIDADVARRVGGWDERFFLYSEEADYLRRVRDAGYTVWFEPDAVVHHAERGSGFSLPLDKLIAVNRIRYARKHMPRARAAAYRAAVALHHLLRSRGPSYRAIFRTVIRESTWWSLPRPHHDTTATSEPDRERRRVVIVAPAADGNDISEAFNAFQWVDLLSQHHDVTVLCTYKEGHAPLSAQLPHVRVIEWQEPPLLGRFERFNSLLQPGYFFFAARARRWLRRHLAGGESFDVAIQVVPVAMRYPSPAAGLGIPFIIGPVGGSLSSPVAFIAEEGGTPWYQRLRALDKLRLRIDPWLRRTYRDADCVLGIAPYAAEALSELAVRRFEVMSEVALRDLPPLSRHEPGADVVRVLHVGRTIRTKGLRDLIRALAQMRDLPVRLDVLGDGNDRAACEGLIAELALGDRVTFHGHVDRDRVDDFYRRADIFAFPSYREPGGGVIMEAMAHGLPLVVCAGGGPAAFVDEDCAVTLDAVSPDQLASDCADALRRLVEDEELRRRMGASARGRAAERHLWTHRIAQMERLWDELIRVEQP